MLFHFFGMLGNSPVHQRSRMFSPLGLFSFVKGVIDIFDFSVLVGEVEVLAGDPFNFVFGIFFLDALQPLFMILVVAFDAV